MKPKSGQSLIELLIAMSILVLAVSAVTFLVLDVYTSNRAGKERIIANFLAREGEEAVRSIRDRDFDELVPGSYGLALSGGKWIFSGNYDDYGKFKRQIIISNVASDIDETDIKKIESRVSWKINPLRQESISLVDYLTDWQQTQGDAGQLSVDLSLAKLGGKDNSELKNIKIKNNGSDDITIDKITVWWNNSRLIEEIRINGKEVWSETGPGTPLGKQHSGTEIDIKDFKVKSGNKSYLIDKFKFDGSMKGAVFMILFRMTDGSTKYTFVQLQ